MTERQRGNKVANPGHPGRTTTRNCRNYQVRMCDTLCHQWNSERILANTFEPLVSSLVTSRLDTLGILGNPPTSIRPEHNLILIWNKGLGVAGCGTGGQLFGGRIHLDYALGHPPPPLPRQPRPKLHRSRPKLQPTDRSNANFIAMSVALRDGRGAVGRAASGVVGKARMRRLLLVRPRPSVAPGSSGVSHTGTRRSLAAGGTRRGCKTCVRPATRA